MSLIVWINELFPKASEPYTLKEIKDELFLRYSSHVTRAAIYRALVRLESSEATKEHVVPMDAVRPAGYSAEGARRIARVVTANLEIDRDESLEVLRKILEPERNFNGNNSAPPLAIESLKVGTTMR